MKHKTIFTGLIVLLLSLLTIANRAQPAPVPEARGPFEVKIWGFRSGGIYFESFAEAAIINKYSSWLRAEAVASAASGKHLLDISKKPELRKNTFFQTPETTNELARRGIKPYKKPYTGARFVVIYFDSAQGFITYNDSIKTWQDLKGKRIQHMPTFVSSGRGLSHLLKDVWKIADKSSVSSNFMPAMARALRDGTADAVHMTINGIGDHRVLGPDLERLTAEKPGYHWISIPAEHVPAVSKASNMPFHPVTFSSGRFPGMTRGNVTLLANVLGLWADETMDPDVVYEFVKVIYEHTDGLKDRYAGTSITRETMAMMPVPEDLFHPGALKFYKEKGVPIGLK